MWIRSQILGLLSGIQEWLDLNFPFIPHDIPVIRYFRNRVAVTHRAGWLNRA
jgi:ABC-type oligopeptide transport system ATPase subunit